MDLLSCKLMSVNPLDEQSACRLLFMIDGGYPFVIHTQQHR
jgi:hypothetical protein